MKRLLGILFFLMAVVIVVDNAAAIERFPPPDFTDHELPVTTTPPPRGIVLEYLDVVALAVGLSLASYFALALRWRRGLFMLAIVSLAWLGFWRKGRKQKGLNDVPKPTFTHRHQSMLAKIKSGKKIEVPIEVRYIKETDYTFQFRIKTKRDEFEMAVPVRFEPKK